MRIAHLSDIHVWRYAFNPIRLLGKRAVGMIELLSGRARRFRLERLAEVVARVRALEPDHVLITGDLTTTALPGEFQVARAALASLLTDPARATVIPGNHDRYTARSVRHRNFERYFGAFAAAPEFPWIKRLDPETGILGLDPTRSHLTATGRLPAEQFARARALLADSADRPRRLIVACHYPLAAPPPYERVLAAKRLKDAGPIRDWLAGIGPHLYCCGHVHAAWAFEPAEIPRQLCLNAGAPLLRDPTGFHLPGFLEIELQGDGVTVIHHAWDGSSWLAVPMLQDPRLFAIGSAAASGG